MKEIRIGAVIALFIVASVAGCATSDQISESARADRASSEDWRSHRDPGVGKYYSSMYSNRAAQKEQKAESMLFNNVFLSFIADGISSFFDRDE